MVPRESPIVPQKKFDLHDQYQANIVYSMMKIGILYNTVMMVIYSRGLLRPCIAYSSLYILSRKSLDKPSRPFNEIGSTWPYQQVNLQVYNHKNKHICNQLRRIPNTKYEGKMTLFLFAKLEFANFSYIINSYWTTMTYQDYCTKFSLSHVYMKMWFWY